MSAIKKHLKDKLPLIILGYGSYAPLHIIMSAPKFGKSDLSLQNKILSKSPGYNKKYIKTE